MRNVEYVNMRKRFTAKEIAQVLHLRKTMKPREIADILDRPLQSIRNLLSRESKRRGVVFPKLRHGLLKHGKDAVECWRGMARELRYKEIAAMFGTPASLVSRKLAQDNRGELVH